jgi:hypothetical protein
MPLSRRTLQAKVLRIETRASSNQEVTMYNSPNPARPRAAKSTETEGTKIIVQYRAKGGKVYELKSGEAVLAVHISSRESREDRAINAGVPGNWHIEAHSNASGLSPSSVDGWGATPAEALREVVRAWTSHAPSLAVFNWEAVTRELHVVRAI